MLGTYNEAYVFKYGGITDRYYNGNKELVAIEYDADLITGPEVTYYPATLKRSSIVLSGEVRRTQLQIKVPSDFKIAELFRYTTPSFVVTVDIRHIRLSGYPQRYSTQVFWKGHVVSVEWGIVGATLLCENFYASIGGNKGARFYSFSCPHVLYGPMCQLNSENFKVEGFFIGCEGKTWNIGFNTPIKNGFFNGGFISFFDDSIMGYNLLRVGKSYGVSPTTNDFPYEQIVNLIQPSYHTPQSMQQVFLFPGCDHTLEMCKNKFNNHINFGGFPWIPPKNPFGSTSAIYW